MEAMTGRILKSHPAKSDRDGKPLREMLPWSRDVFTSVIDKAPMMWTRQEFLERFCDHYNYDPIIKDVIAADAEGTRKIEW
jgi:hypothetical protein